MSASLHDFASSFFLWRDALVASVAVALLCGWLGVYILLKRIVFVSAALPQASGLGIALSFYIGSFIAPHAHEQTFLLNPLFMALLFSCAAAALFSLNIDSRRISGETVIGIVYILCSALVLEVLNSPRIVQEAHEIGDILFGNAVVIDSTALIAVLVVTAVVILVHLLFYKEFVAVMFDTETAAVLGLRVRFWNLLLYLTIAFAVSTSIRAIGALPVFGFMVIPACSALMLSRGLKMVIALSMGIGVFAAVVGYFLSFVYSLPTGATMVAVASLWLIPGLIKRD